MGVRRHRLKVIGKGARVQLSTVLTRKVLGDELRTLQSATPRRTPLKPIFSSQQPLGAPRAYSYAQLAIYSKMQR